MPANLGNSAVASGLEKSVFIPIPKKGNAKEWSNNHKIVLISHASEVMLRILQTIPQYLNRELPYVQAGFRKAEEPVIKLPTSVGLLKKQENSRKNISCFIDYTKDITVWITTNCGKFFKS